MPSWRNSFDRPFTCEVLTLFEKSALVDSSTMYCAVGSEMAVQRTVYPSPDCEIGGALTFGTQVGAVWPLVNAYAEEISSPSSSPIQENAMSGCVAPPTFTREVKEPFAGMVVRS